MEQEKENVFNDRYFPQSYLIIPFYTGHNKEDYDCYKDYFNICNTDASKHWKHSLLIYSTKTEENITSVFRYTTHFDYVNQFFHAIEGSDKKQYNDDCVVLELKGKEKFHTKYDKDNPGKYNSYFEDPFNEGKNVDVTFQCRNNSIDSIRLFINLSAKTGLLTIPIRPDEIPITEYQNFISYIRELDRKCIKTKNINDNNYYWRTADKEWCLNEMIDELLMDFNGHYNRVNAGFAQHLTFILVDKEDIGNEYDDIIQGITRCKNSNQTKGFLPCELLRISNNIKIGASQEGTTIITAEKLRHDPDQKKQYATEQMERIVLYFVVTLQRYILLRVISDLARHNINSSYNQSNGLWDRLQSGVERILHSLKLIFYPSTVDTSEIFDKRNLKKLRKEVGVVCRTKARNSFSSISDTLEVNEYYRFCCKALEIDKLYSEIDNKVKNLDSYLTQLSDGNKERADWHLSIILATLTVMSASNDGIQIIDRINNPDHKYPWLYIAGLIIVIFFVAYLIYTIVKTRR